MTETDSANLEYADRMRTAIIETLYYIAHQMINEKDIRDAHVDDQFAKFLPMIILFVSKNLEDEKHRLSPVGVA